MPASVRSEGGRVVLLCLRVLWLPDGRHPCCSVAESHCQGVAVLRSTSRPFTCTTTRLTRIVALTRQAMGTFKHPHLVRGVVHTSFGSFRIERGLADLPEDVGEALGWSKVLSAADEGASALSLATSSGARESASTSTSLDVATPSTPARKRKAATVPASQVVALEAVLAGVESAVRYGDTVELPARGIDVTFDSAVVATCRHCRVSWEVSARHFKNLAWWSCPQRCAPQASN